MAQLLPAQFPQQEDECQPAEDQRANHADEFDGQAQPAGHTIRFSGGCFNSRGDISGRGHLRDGFSIHYAETNRHEEQQHGRANQQDEACIKSGVVSKGALDFLDEDQRQEHQQLRHVNERSFFGDEMHDD